MQTRLGGLLLIYTNWPPSINCLVELSTGCDASLEISPNEIGSLSLCWYWEDNLWCLAWWSWRRSRRILQVLFVQQPLCCSLSTKYGGCTFQTDRPPPPATHWVCVPWLYFIWECQSVRTAAIVTRQPTTTTLHCAAVFNRVNRKCWHFIMMC